MEEIAVLKSRIQECGTGHLYTTISTLENRVLENKREVTKGSILMVQVLSEVFWRQT